LPDELTVLELDQLSVAQNPSVVDENIDPATFNEDCINLCLHIGAAGNINLVKRRLHAKKLDSLLPDRLVHIANNHFRTIFVKTQCGGLTNP
jgi:hypothetical protein